MASNLCVFSWFTCSWMKFFFSLSLVILISRPVDLLADDVPRQNPDKMETITIADVIFKPEGQYDIAVAPEGYRLGLIQLLRKYGFNALGGENALFGKDNSAAARFHLGGVIERISCIGAAYRVVQDCEIQVTWELMDTQVNKVRYKVKTRFFHALNTSQFKQDFPKMVGGSLMSLLKREKFVAMLQRDAQGNVETVYEPATLARCDANLTLPAGMQKALSATVLIKEGEGVGSGFFISEDGFILTANHVVSARNSVEIVTHGGQKVAAVVVRRNLSQDVALLKANMRSPSCFAIADAISVGSEIYGIGAPAGEMLSFSVSRGIVSGLRKFKGNSYLQTDASLNPGNSGGPLLSTNGEVLAIVSWKLMIPGFEGISFGVPVVDGLASMSLAMAKVTDFKTAEIEAAQKNTANAELKTFVDISDISHLNELKAKQVAQQRKAKKAVQELQDAQWQSRENQVQQDITAREKRQKTVASVFQKIWFFSSLAMLTTGALMVAGTVGNLKSAQTGSDEYYRLRSINTAGWVTGGIGLLSIGIFYVSGFRLRGPSAAKKVQASLSGVYPRMTGLNVSANGIWIDGYF
ncbi:MAG: trypsin-like peptidase domain-containing protein [Deltaproteobacteria bacterium]|nr:trypsin-like peptidase domain-containing protein [Deltaproteobacteria bacterium]